MSKKTTRTRREVIDNVFNVNDFGNQICENWLLNFKLKQPFYFNPNHKQFYNCLKDSQTKMAFVDGHAGTMKTYIAVYAALEMISNNECDRLIYIRSVAESAERSLGALPGEVDDKFLPYAMPLLEKVREITSESTAAMLKQRGIIEAIPVNFVRGLTFNKSVVVVDEAQNLTDSQTELLLTRMCSGSKLIFCGDNAQIDLKDKKTSGFDFMCKHLIDVPGFSVISLQTNHRHEIVEPILDVYKNFRN